jgi:hypothetical protein
MWSTTSVIFLNAELKVQKFMPHTKVKKHDYYRFIEIIPFLCLAAVGMAELENYWWASVILTILAYAGFSIASHEVYKGCLERGQVIERRGPHGHLVAINISPDCPMRWLVIRYIRAALRLSISKID